MNTGFPTMAAGTVEGTGSAINVEVGFAPRYVRCINIDDAGGIAPSLEWIEGMAAANAIKSTNSAPLTIPVPLTSLREVASNAIPNAAGIGGVLASDTTPILNLTNGDTDSALRLSWAASNSDGVTFQVPLPAELDTASDLTITFKAAMAGATDTPVISADTFFDVGDTKVEDDSAAVTGTTPADYTITIAAADIPSGADTMSVELTPGAHTTDILYIYSIKVSGTITGVSKQALATSNGITAYTGSSTVGSEASVGFTIGADADVNVSAETILWMALR